MARWLVLSALGLVAVALLLSATEESLEPERELPVGRVARAYRDPERHSWVGDEARPLDTLVWYPAAPGAAAAEWFSGVGPFKIFRFGVSAAGAPRRPGRYPLVLLSHGTGGSPRQLAWIGEALASAGFVVAAVSHHGNTSDESASIPHGYYLWWERAADLSRVLDRILADPELAAAVDPRRVGAAGFSLGGYTVLALAGARVSLEQYDAWCAAAVCTGPPEAPMPPAAFYAHRRTDRAVSESLARAERSYRDERVRAVFAIAPALGPVLDPGSLHDVAIPTSLVVGERDDLVGEVRQIAAALPDTAIEVLPGAGHYTFLAPCGWLGRLAVAALCRDTGDLRRAEVHRHVAQRAVAFFRATLDGESRPPPISISPAARIH